MHFHLLLDIVSMFPALGFVTVLLFFLMEHHATCKTWGVNNRRLGSSLHLVNSRAPNARHVMKLETSIFIRGPTRQINVFCFSKSTHLFYFIRYHSVHISLINLRTKKATSCIVLIHDSVSIVIDKDSVVFRWKLCVNICNFGVLGCLLFLGLVIHCHLFSA
jgi:hypothetical protein